MKHGLMDTMWKWKCSLHNWLEKFAETEKCAAGQGERQSHVDGFFLYRGCCLAWILTSEANSESLVLSRSAEASKRRQQKRTPVVGKQLLGPPTWQCASSCIASDSLLFGFQSHPTHLTWLRQTFSYFPNWKETLKGRRFQTIQDITEDSQRELRAIPKRRKRTVSRSGKGVESGASMQEGSTLKVIRLTQLQACPKKIKIVLKLFEQTMYNTRARCINNPKELLHITSKS
jgi:hypothetical protein